MCPQLLSNLEGIRYVVEVTARLCAAGHAVVAEWLNKATRLCSLWEYTLHRCVQQGNCEILSNVSCLQYAWSSLNHKYTYAIYF